MLSNIESVTIKLKSAVHAKKSAIWAGNKKVAGATQDAARVLRIMIFLHSAKDLTSVLRLYGIDNSSAAK